MWLNRVFPKIIKTFLVLYDISRNISENLHGMFKSIFKMFVFTVWGQGSREAVVQLTVEDTTVFLRSGGVPITSSW